MVLGEKPTEGGFGGSIEKTKTTKADLEKALAASFAYCDKVHAGMTDAAGAAIVKFFLGEMAKLSVLEFNTHHDFEHYGNIVTYMRLKNLVPPSSEQIQQSYQKRLPAAAAVTGSGRSTALVLDRLRAQDVHLDRERLEARAR